MRATPLLFFFLLSVLLGSAHSITIPTVIIGNPGNPNDVTGFGGVSYTYAIGKYEVSLFEYTAFLNAVAKTDTYSLYDSSMGTDLNMAGISQSGVSGSFTYSVLGDGNRPVSYVTWFDAARFTNWLHNGQPTGLQAAATTEQGAYTLNGALSGVINKNVNANTWIPSESEWYKAAYYQPAAAGGDGDGYWLYPTRSNSVPGNDIGANPNQANIFDANDNGGAGGFSLTQSSYNSSQNYLTPGGAYSASASYYGTFDQGGSLSEWNDAVIEGTARGVRGGSWALEENELRASTRRLSDPSFDFGYYFGFRIATVPEPTVVVNFAVGVLLLLAGRKSPFRC